MKANVKTKTAVKEISKILNECTILVRLDLDKYASFYTLSVATDKGEGAFQVKTKEKMLSFLSDLQKVCSYNYDDIGELIEELE